MNPATAYLVNTAALACVVALPLDDGSGTKSVDYANSPEDGTFVGSPTLTVSADHYQASVTGMRGASGKYVLIPKAKVLAILAGSWTWTFRVRFNGTAGTTPGSYCLSGSDVQNGFNNLASESGLAIAMRGGSGADDTPNKISFHLFSDTNSAGGAGWVACQVVTNSIQYDGEWHRVTVTHTAAAGGTIQIAIDDTYGTAVTGVDVKLPTVLNDLGLGLGAYVSGAGVDTSLDTSGQFDFADVSFHEDKLTRTQVFGIENVVQGNTGAVLEGNVPARALKSLAARQLATCLTASDSNERRSHNPFTFDAGQPNIAGYDQGYLYTQSLILQAASGTTLAGILLGTMGPTFTSAAYLGCTTSLMSGYDAVGGANPPAAFIQARDMALWNNTAAGGTNPFAGSGASSGFGFDAHWVRTDATLTYANSQTTIDTTSAYWPLASNAKLRIEMPYATFDIVASGDRGKIYPNFKVGATVVGGDVVESCSDVDTWSGPGTALANVRLEIGTLANGTSGVLSLALSAGSVLGPLATAEVLVRDTNRTSGWILGSFWAYGSMGANELASALATGQITAAMVQEFFLRATQAAADLGQARVALFRRAFGQNDINKTTQRSYTYDPATDTWSNTGTAYSDKREGFYNNQLAITLYLNKILTAVGITLYHQFGPYHMVDTAPGSWPMQIRYARAERMIMDLYPTRIFRFSGTDAVLETTLSAAVTHGTPNGYSNDGTKAHLSRGGYELLAEAPGEAWGTVNVTLTDSTSNLLLLLT